MNFRSVFVRSEKVFAREQEQNHSIYPICQLKSFPYFPKCANYTNFRRERMQQKPRFIPKRTICATDVRTSVYWQRFFSFAFEIIISRLAAAATACTFNGMRKSFYLVHARGFHAIGKFPSRMCVSFVRLMLIAHTVCKPYPLRFARSFDLRCCCQWWWWWKHTMQLHEIKFTFSGSLRYMQLAAHLALADRRRDWGAEQADIALATCNWQNTENAVQNISF